MSPLQFSILIVHFKLIFRFMYLVVGIQLILKTNIFLYTTKTMFKLVLSYKCIFNNSLA